MACMSNYVYALTYPCRNPIAGVANRCQWAQCWKWHNAEYNNNHNLFFIFSSSIISDLQYV